MDEKRKNDTLILDELREIKESAKEVSIKITTIETVLIGVKDSPGLTGIVQEHGKQITKLMSWRYQVLGGVFVIVAIGSYIVKYVL